MLGGRHGGLLVSEKVSNSLFFLCSVWVREETKEREKERAREKQRKVCGVRVCAAHNTIGYSLMELLDAAEPEARNCEKPLRLAVQAADKIGKT